MINQWTLLLDKWICAGCDDEDNDILSTRISCYLHPFSKRSHLQCYAASNYYIRGYSNLRGLTSLFFCLYGFASNVLFGGCVFIVIIRVVLRYSLWRVCLCKLTLEGLEVELVVWVFVLQDQMVVSLVEDSLVSFLLLVLSRLILNFQDLVLVLDL